MVHLLGILGRMFWEILVGIPEFLFDEMLIRSSKSNAAQAARLTDRLEPKPNPGNPQLPRKAV